MNKPKVESIVAIRGYMARDEHGFIDFFLNVPKKRLGMWVGGGFSVPLGKAAFPEVRMSDGPTECEILVRKL